MSKISQKQIRLGFRKRFDQLGLTDGNWSNVALENRLYTPMQDAQGNDIPYFQLNLLTSSRQQKAQGFSGQSGFMQVNYNVPTGSGAYDADDMIDTLAHGFINQRLDGGAYVYQTVPRISEPGEKWYTQIIDLMYRITQKT